MSVVAVSDEPRTHAIQNHLLAVASRRLTLGKWRISLVSVGALAAFVAFLISIYVNPAPRVHDEFSYMLAGDTILHGRLANPTPPAWEALQSFHTVMQPHYASKYPVGTGLLVATGMLLGKPLASSWLAIAMMTVCVTWMLAGVLPRALGNPWWRHYLAQSVYSVGMVAESLAWLLTCKW